jgi:protein-S-isoprenylcysteine O-methyltransferase Ste14
MQQGAILAFHNITGARGPRRVTSLQGRFPVAQPGKSGAGGQVAAAPFGGLTGAEQVVFQSTHFGFLFPGCLRAIRHGAKISDPPPPREERFRRALTSGGSGSTLPDRLRATVNAMNSEGALRIAFWALFGLTILMRSWFALRVRRAGERLWLDRASVRREGWLAHSLRLSLLLLFVAVMALSALDLPWKPKLHFSLPFWVRWTGFAVGLASLGFWTWTHLALGTLWSAQLQLRAHHRLVACGPYLRVRHPMYTAILAWVASLGVVSANWIPVFFAALAAVFLVARVPREEQMMLERFGDEYREYMRRTGRFLPKWRGRPGNPA